MVSITLAVPVDLKQKMDQFAEINWSAVARAAFTQKVADLDFIKTFKSQSILTEDDAIQLGRELNKKLAKKRK